MKKLKIFSTFIWISTGNSNFSKSSICVKRVLPALTSLICVIGLLGCNDGNLLTLDKVLELSAKGEDLTWSDFEQYESKDVGSGLYIYFYDIDDTFGLWIGGVPSDKPMYMRLATKTDLDNAIDIRTGDVKAFIKENKK